MINREGIREELRRRENCHRIIGEEHMFRSAVLIPLMKEPGGWSLLFQKRAAAIRQGGEICFPGGSYDPGQDKGFKETALRETCEEIGTDPDQIEILGTAGTLVTPMSVIVRPYLGILDIGSLQELTPNRDEVESLFTIPLEWFRNNEPSVYDVPVRVHPYSVDKKGGEKEIHFPSHELDLPERYKSPWEGSIPHKIWTYRSGEGIIWGITAQILLDILPFLLGDSSLACFYEKG